MDTNSKVAEPAQGAALAEETVTIAQIKDYLKRDLTICQSLIHAIQSDQDLLDTMAHFMHGRFMNDLHRKSLSKQES